MAQAVVDISMLGDKELERKLAALTGPRQKAMVRPALRAGAKPIKKQAEANAKALSPGAGGTGALARAKYKIRAVRRSRRSIGVRVMSPTREELGIGPDERAYYPAVLEFGTARRPPAGPLLRAAKQTAETESIREISKELRKRIEAEAKKKQ